MKRKWPVFLLLFLLAVAAAAFFLVAQPYLMASSNHAPDGITVHQQEDGTLALSWEPTPQADFYTVTLTHPTLGEQFREVVAVSSCTLPRQATEEALTLRVTPGQYYTVLGKTQTRDSANFTEVTVCLLPPTAADLRYRVDPAAGTLTLSLSLPQTDTAYMAWQSPDGTQTEIPLSRGAHILSFGEDLPIPAWNENLTLTLRAERHQTGFSFYGLDSASIPISGELFLDRDMALSVTDLGNNRCSLSWEEASGDGYEVRVRRAGETDWTLLQTLDAQTRSFETPRLAPLTQYEFQVAAIGVEPETLSNLQPFVTDITPVYCTVWPVQDLRAYTTPKKSAVAGHVETGKAYCVLAEEDGMFAVRVDEQTCYIDSRYCMINLPEYLGELCCYNITNSYDSKYLVHEYEMPQISGTVILGYEDIRLADDSYLVPLLYPTAKMLREAAQTATNYGYRLKIYDAYRPNEATVDLFDRMVGMLDTRLPSETFTGKEVTDLVTAYPTYRLVMTNNVWPINYFLARGVSKHNLGVAVDLTLEDLATGQEILMQTSIHDLSWYSCLQRNNDAANILTKIMKSAGFTGLSSEWWHFQDDESRFTLGLPAVSQGFSAEGWMFDGKQWYYRNADGTVSAGEA